MKARVNVLAGPAIGRTVELDDGNTLVIGRGGDAQLCVAEDGALSRRHCVLEQTPSGWAVRDLGSRHGILVNGQRATQAALRDGDRIQAGETLIEIRVELQATTLDWTAATLAAPGSSTYGGGGGEREDAPVLPAGFRMIRMLGRGAMGCVYLAHDEKRDVLRAIKQIEPRVAMSSQMRAMFLREAKVQARLVHPNVVQIHDLLEPDQGHFSIVMEFVEGQSADKMIASGPLDWRLAVAIACQALDGIAHAHSLQIVHRDLKEGNLLVSEVGGQLVVKVADFGLAKNYQESGASGLTSDGALGGTLPYMAREQLLDFRYVKPPADIYAMGATLYRLLSGCFPRDYREGENWVLVSLERAITPLSQRVAAHTVPHALCAAVERALATDPGQRYRSAVEMRQALAQYLA